MTHQTSIIEADVVVVGAGSAGVSAAVAAAEGGARTVLVEASGQVGGSLSWQLLEHSAGFHNVHGDQVVGGFGQRLVDVLAAAGASPGHIRDDVGYTATRTPLNHAELAMAESRLLVQAGVRLLLNAPVVSAQTRNGRIVALVAEGAGGRLELRARVFVDASGDAVVAAAAGARFQTDVAATQPASLLFKIAGLDFEKLLDYARSNPDDFRAESIVGDAGDEHVNLWGFGALLARGRREDVLSLYRTEMHLAGWPRRGEAIANVTRAALPSLDAVDAGATYLELQAQVLEFAQWFRQHVPGGADSYVAAVADRLGVRESRRILGVATLSQTDVVTGFMPPDAIGIGAFPIDIHDAASAGLSHTEAVGAGYGIPYGALVSADFDNLLAAGRCVSSTHESNGSIRITATCFVTGEAAGAAAALTAAGDAAAADIDVSKLRGVLRTRGVIGVGASDRSADPVKA